MKNKIFLLLSLSFLLIVAFIMSSCQTASQTTTTTTMAASTVKICVITDQASYASLETVVFSLIVTNEGTTTIEVINGRAYPSRYTIKNSSEVEVTTLPEVFPSSFSNYSLPPGSTEINSVSWEQKVPSTSAEVIARGTYHVVGDSVYTTKIAAKEFTLTD